jgi:predicted secreted hydrolase
VKRFSVILIVILVIGGALFGASQLQGRTQSSYSADVVAALSSGDTTGFARATTVREFKFPVDHGAHPEYQTEWWYYTGNLATVEGRRFGFQFTIFRRAIAPTIPSRQSDWATNQIYFAHLAVSDIGDNKFYSTEQYSRGAAGLAGAQGDPKVRVWIQDWTMTAQDVEAKIMQLKATDGPIAINLTTNQVKPIVLQGDHGLSQKSLEVGNASYYYSETRLLTKGTITINGTVYQVEGNSWLDREWSTSVLSQDTVGWDWFALQLDNNRELMLYIIRKKDGSVESVSHGTLIEADGTKSDLELADFQIEAKDHWTSPRLGAIYPSGWKVTVNATSGPILLDITPLMQDQELNTVTAYWEGASIISGTDNGKPVNGYGYVELTGYNQAANQAEQATR